MRVEEVDVEEHAVLAFSSERDFVTHLLVWRLERLWLHVLKLGDISDAMKGESHFQVEETMEEKGSTRGPVSCSIIETLIKLLHLLKLWRTQGMKLLISVAFG